MSYDWPRIHKSEEWYENQIIDEVVQHVLDWFGVEYIAELTEDQIGEVCSFYESNEKLSEYSVMQCGFSHVIMVWENSQ